MELGMGVTIQQALTRVSEKWESARDMDMIATPVYELIGFTLFDIANSGDVRVRGSIRRSTRAQKIIMNRMVGLRRPGSRPVTRENDGLEFVDLTVGVIE